jgi:hypothetical protein
VEEAEPVGDRHGLELRVAAQLPEEMADVVAHGRLCEAEPDGDLASRDPLGEELEHLALAPAERTGRPRCAPPPWGGAASRLHLSL